MCSPSAQDKKKTPAPGRWIRERQTVDEMYIYCMMDNLTKKHDGVGGKKTLKITNQQIKRQRLEKIV